MAASDDRQVVAELARRLAGGEEVVVATAVRTEGAPCKLGQKLLGGLGGPLAGTLGCSELDTQATAFAAEVLASGGPQLRMLDHDLGRVEVWFEPYPARPALVVLGATPVAEHLLRWAGGLGYYTVLVDPRPERLTPELVGLADSVSTSVEEVARQAARTGRPLDAVHTDHDAPEIAAHLATLLAVPARFVGIMGSARHVGHHLEGLRRMGVAEADVARVHSPVGLNIGAVTAQEVAVSILAGLMAARTGRQGGWLDAANGSADLEPGTHRAHE